MLRVDELTSIHSREKFARICVEIDHRRKLVPSFFAWERKLDWSIKAYTKSTSIVADIGTK
ncbi:hypothetical protein AHAS_Ahas15G0355300 [Arachis hypogaea]|uniref:Uncharacterized protein n=1 Tax=Arachis hypogaea TaxID=3818 RepID=A0A444YZD0_ARAHY|nr:hypothetical protein Ahy_B05g074617 [Arachis hypogaea]